MSAQFLHFLGFLRSFDQNFLTQWSLQFPFFSKYTCVKFLLHVLRKIIIPYIKFTIITYWAKLPTADWLRQRAFFFLILFQWRAKFLDFDWPSGKTTGSWLDERTASAFRWLFEKFWSEFSNAAIASNFDFLATFSVEKHGNQAIAWREFWKRWT